MDHGKPPGTDNGNGKDNAHDNGHDNDPGTELERLRAEVARLRDRTATDRRRRARTRTLRRTVAAVLVALAAVVAVMSVVGVWGSRTTLNTDRWVATVGPLPKDPEVNTAVATYLSQEIFTQLDVERRLTEALPPRAAFLAGPLTGAVQDYVRKIVAELMATDRFQDLWEAANRRAHDRIVDVLEERGDLVETEGDTVRLDLLPLVNNLLDVLEDRLPSVFGKELDLPTLSSGEVPPELRQRIETALGVTLPEDFAQIRFYDRGELGQLQDAVLMFKRAVVGLVVAVPVLLALALWVSPDRRRTLLQLGLWLVVTVTVLTSVVRAVRDQLLGQVDPGVYREGVRSALWTVFTTLRERGDQLLWFGVGLAVLAYLAGPGRLPVALRRYAAQGARAGGHLAARAGERIGKDATVRPWTARHADALRTGGAVLAVLIALLLSSWTALLVIALLLAGFEIAVTLLARGQDPSPPAGEAPRGAPAHTGAPDGHSHGEGA
ncbi:hypothetical protein [Streptomyces sp. CRN 30]|uniref:hypothetical protein n=1 Tax=Streptomyces sp. CRN 30 TaxID=3075613 RepID=UPI002A7EE937|nr:hypothetical protein [Streptomyces sp. CRN 30]